MSHGLSPQAEQYLAEVVAGGLFPSKEAALEAAVAALRASTESIPTVPPEHMAAVEAGIESLNAGRCREFTDQDWDDLIQLAVETAAKDKPDRG